MTAELLLYTVDYPAWVASRVPSTIDALRREDDAEVLRIWRAMGRDRQGVMWEAMDNELRERIRRLADANPAA